MDELVDKFSNININKKVLYYSVIFENYDEIIDIVKESLGEHFKVYVKTETFDFSSIDEKLIVDIEKIKNNSKFAIYNNSIYIINDEFHITTLFTGGKIHEKSELMIKQHNKKVSVKINKIAYSNNFIVLGVDDIITDDEEEFYYFGNPVKHITFGLNKFNKKVFPKDSYTALNDNTIDIDKTIYGICSFT
jgi:hypothetical protein